MFKWGDTERGDDDDGDENDTDEAWIEPEEEKIINTVLLFCQLIDKVEAKTILNTNKYPDLPI